MFAKIWQKRVQNLLGHPVFHFKTTWRCKQHIQKLFERITWFFIYASLHFTSSWWAHASARALARSLPLLHCCVITEQKVTRKTWEEATPDVSGLFSCCFYSFSRSENLKIMAVFNWNYLSFVNFDSTWVYREMVLIPILIVILWFVWMKVVR